MGVFDFMRRRQRQVRLDDAGTQLGVVRKDGWISMLTGFGDPQRDKRESVGFFADIVTDAQARELWRGDDMASRIIEALPGAMHKRGFITKVQDKVLQENLDNEHERLGVARFFKTAKQYARAYGGGALFPVLNDSRDQLQPLNMDAVLQVRALIVFEPRELRPATWYNDPSQPRYGEPESYDVYPISPSGVTRPAPNLRIHESRLIIWPGIRVSRGALTGTNLGWGDSVLTRVNRVLRDFNIGWSAAGVLLHDFSQAVHKIDGLAAMVGMNRDQDFRNRLIAMEMARSTVRATVIDSKDSYERQSTPLTGMPDLLEKFFIRLAAAARMPVTVLAGMSPSGLNATGQSDIQLWDDQVEEEQKEDDPQAKKMSSLILAQRSVRGIKRPKIWSMKWLPIRQEPKSQETASRKTQAETDVAYIQIGVLSAEEVAFARFGGDEYSYDTHVDFAARQSMQPAAPAPVLQSVPKDETEEDGAPTDDEVDGESGDDEVEVDADDSEAAEAGGGDGAKDGDGKRAARADTIEHRDGRWLVLSEAGDKLGDYDTEGEAEHRLHQIEWFKAHGGDRDE